MAIELEASSLDEERGNKLEPQKEIINALKGSKTPDQLYVSLNKIILDNKARYPQLSDKIEKAALRARKAMVETTYKTNDDEIKEEAILDINDIFDEQTAWQTRFDSVKYILNTLVKAKDFSTLKPETQKLLQDLKAESDNIEGELKRSVPPMFFQKQIQEMLKVLPPQNSSPEGEKMGYIFKSELITINKEMVENEAREAGATVVAAFEKTLESAENSNELDRALDSLITLLNSASSELFQEVNSVSTWNYQSELKGEPIQIQAIQKIDGKLVIQVSYERVRDDSGKLTKGLQTAFFYEEGKSFQEVNKKYADVIKQEKKEDEQQAA